MPENDRNRLKARLEALRAAQAQPSRAPGLSEPSLGQRLGRLGPKGAAGTRRRPRPEDSVLARELGGEVAGPGVIRVETSQPLGRRHGRIPLRRAASRTLHLGLADAVDPQRLLFLDTETSGLAGGAGTWVFLCGLARLRRDRLVTRQYLLTRLTSEFEFLERLAGEVGAEDLLVTFNGKTFDLPLLATRCRLGGLHDPFAGLAHLDLLWPLRQAFGAVWSDCRLATAERKLLEFRRLGDLPGSEAPAAWRDFLRQGEAGRLAGVLGHNRWDLLSLAALLPALDDAFEWPMAAGADIAAVARRHRKQGRERQALELLTRHEAALGRRALLELADLCRKGEDWRRACAIWERLAGRGVLQALEALAKYHEHRGRDHRLALAFAERLPTSAAKIKRCDRLRRRMQREGTIHPSRLR